MKKLALVLCAFCLMEPVLRAQELSASDLDRRRVELRKALDDQWEYVLRTNPEFASILGDRRYNDQSSDASEKAVLADLAQTRKFLKRFEAIDKTAFSDQERLNRDLMIKGLRDTIEGSKFKGYEM